MYIDVFLFIALIVVSTLCGFFAAALMAAAGRSELQDENLRLLMENELLRKKNKDLNNTIQNDPIHLLNELTKYMPNY